MIKPTIIVYEIHFSINSLVGCGRELRRGFNTFSKTYDSYPAISPPLIPEIYDSPFMIM
jgi:hypothetical protein